MGTKEKLKEGYESLKRIFMCSVILVVGAVFISIGVAWLFGDADLYRFLNPWGILPLILGYELFRFQFKHLIKHEITPLQ